MPTIQRCASAVLTLGLVAMMSSVAAAQQLDLAGEAAYHLLRRSMETGVNRRGATVAVNPKLLDALRHLRDPALAPLFEKLTKSPVLSLRYQGILALGELADPPGLDLERLINIDSPELLASIISKALDGDLLSNDQVQQMLSWQELDAGVKIILASQLIKEGQAVDPAILRQVAGSDLIGRRGWAMLLLLQTDPLVTADQLAASLDPNDAQYDMIRESLLGAAFLNEFDRAVTWATMIRTEPNVGPNLALTALRLELRFNAPGAAAEWTRLYNAEQSVAQKTRYGIIALQAASALKPSLFDVMIESENVSSLLVAMGHVGKAIASQRQISEKVIELIQFNHPRLSQWAMDYARRYASDADAQAIFVGAVLALDGPPQQKVQRFANSVAAAQLLYERDAPAATAILHGILAEPQSNELTRAITLGLVQANRTDAFKPVLGLPEFEDKDTRLVVLLLKAKHGRPLTDEQMQRLAVVVRGGDRLQEMLRIQAAWTYLKRTQQHQTALTKALQR